MEGQDESLPLHNVPDQQDAVQAAAAGAGDISTGKCDNVGPPQDGADAEGAGKIGNGGGNGAAAKTAAAARVGLAQRRDVNSWLTVDAKGANTDAGLRLDAAPKPQDSARSSMVQRVFCSPRAKDGKASDEATGQKMPPPQEDDDDSMRHPGAIVPGPMASAVNQYDYSSAYPELVPLYIALEKAAMHLFAMAAREAAAAGESPKNVLFDVARDERVLNKDGGDWQDAGDAGSTLDKNTVYHLFVASLLKPEMEGEGVEGGPPRSGNQTEMLAWLDSKASDMYEHFGSTSGPWDSLADFIADLQQPLTSLRRLARDLIGDQAILGGAVNVEGAGDDANGRVSDVTTDNVDDDGKVPSKPGTDVQAELEMEVEVEEEVEFEEEEHGEETEEEDAAEEGPVACTDNPPKMHPNGTLAIDFELDEDVTTETLADLSELLVGIGKAGDCDPNRLRSGGDLEYATFLAAFRKLNLANFPKTRTFRNVMKANDLPLEKFGNVHEQQMFWGERGTDYANKNIMAWWEAMFFGTAEDGNLVFDQDSTLLTRCYPRDLAPNKKAFDKDWKKAVKDQEKKQRAEEIRREREEKRAKKRESRKNPNDVMIEEIAAAKEEEVKKKTKAANERKERANRYAKRYEEAQE